jgi:hypothetical protein
MLAGGRDTGLVASEALSGHCWFQHAIEGTKSSGTTSTAVLHQPHANIGMP